MYAVVNFETFNSRSSSEHCSQHQFNKITRLSWMNVRQKDSSLNPKKQQSRQVQMHAVSLVSTLKFQLVISVERTRIFWPKIDLRSLKGQELTKFTKKIFWKYILLLKWIQKMENLPRNKEQPLFACILTPILQEADRWSKSKHSPANASEIYVILAWSTKWCHFLSLKLSMFC